MAEISLRQVLVYRLVFIGLAGFVIFMKLLPLQPGPGGIPGPDLLLLIAIAWVVRRPEYLPVTLIVIVMFMADILFLRPLGLWTALAVVGSEYLRRRAGPLRDGGFLTEWLTVAVVISAMHILNALVLMIFVADQPSFGLTLIRILMTVLAYPVVVVLAARAIGLSKAGPGEGESLGRAV